MSNVQKHELVEYIRDIDNRIVGVFVGFMSNQGQSKIGWSLYPLDDALTFRPDFKKNAINLARQRAQVNINLFPGNKRMTGDIPSELMDDLKRFNNRCARYFHDRSEVAVAELDQIVCQEFNWETTCKVG